MSKEKTAGVIYILTNPSFPQYVKIGYADDINKRLKELNRSECIPFAFRAYAVYEVNERLKDIAIHKMIDNINPNLRAIETFDGKKRKKEFFEMTADDAYGILETIAGLSGTTDRLHLLTPEGHEIIDEEIAAEAENSVTYSEEPFLQKADPDIRALYEKLRCTLIALDGVTVEPKKLYIAFKNPKNFADVEVQKHTLKIFLNLRRGELYDPEDVADDVSNIGHWGNGDYRIYMKDEADFEYVLGLIMQSYQKNGERG
ncbi:MAG: GIY-YIG nuclease family protein [Lachnospiraceae bacterium]|nr:GIY-YIG nuclease family protein [Lachnospiraceae bacterium]